jgi:hypothetical protein
MQVWLELYHKTGSKTLINMSRVVKISQNSDRDPSAGCVLWFSMTMADNDYIIVRETYEEIHTRLGLGLRS